MGRYAANEVHVAYPAEHVRAMVYISRRQALRPGRAKVRELLSHYPDLSVGLLSLVVNPSGYHIGRRFGLSPARVSQLRRAFKEDWDRFCSLPFDQFDTQVDRLAPVAAKGDVQSSVTVYCRLQESSTDLRPGMTGNARVYSGKRPVGAILLERAMRFVRTEFWW